MSPWIQNCSYLSYYESKTTSNFTDPLKTDTELHHEDLNNLYFI